jgi:hypothetical protein
MSPTEYARYMLKDHLRRHKTSIRKLAPEMEMTHATMARFLRGNPVESVSLDKIYSFFHVDLP